MSESAIVREVADKAAQHVTRKVICDLQKMTDTLSGDDSELKTAWDEICAQVQYQESFYWAVYDETVRRVIEQHLGLLSKYEREAIWLQTESGVEWVCDDEHSREPAPINDEDIVEWVAREYVYSKADNWSNARIRAYIERSSMRD
jgi:hypothetical protein